MFDSARGGKNDAKDGAKGYVAQAQDMAGSAAQVVSDNLKGASDYISGSSGAVKK